MGNSGSTSICWSKKTEAACKEVSNECKWAHEKPCFFCRARTACHKKSGGRSLSDRMTENAQPIDSLDAGILRAIDDNRWD